MKVEGAGTKDRSVWLVHLNATICTFVAGASEDRPGRRTVRPRLDDANRETNRRCDSRSRTQRSRRSDLGDGPVFSVPLQPAGLATENPDLSIDTDLRVLRVDIAITPTTDVRMASRQQPLLGRGLKGSPAREIGYRVQIRWFCQRPLSVEGPFLVKGGLTVEWPPVTERPLGLQGDAPFTQVRLVSSDQGE